MADKKPTDYLGKRVTWTSSANGTGLTKMGMVIAQRIDGKWRWCGPEWAKTYKRNSGVDTRWLGPRVELIVELYASRPLQGRTWKFHYGRPRYMRPYVSKVKIAKW